MDSFVRIVISMMLQCPMKVSFYTNREVKASRVKKVGTLKICQVNQKIIVSLRIYYRHQNKDCSSSGRRGCEIVLTLASDSRLATKSTLSIFI